MKVIAGAIGLVVALTLILAAVAFAQIDPASSTNNMTNNNGGINPKSTDPTPPPPQTPTTPTASPAPAADCPSEIEGMNAVLKALPTDTRATMGGAGQLPAIPCDGYKYAADFTIVPDTPASPAPTAPQAQEQPTQTVTSQKT